MFDFIRTHQRLMQFLLLLFIFPSFAFFGLEGYTRFREGDDSVAKVAGQSITKQELDAAQRDQMERFRQMFGAQFDPKMLDTPEARQNILDGLISERVLLIEARKSLVTPTETQIQAAVLSAFPNLGDPSLSKEDRIKLYNSLVQSRGMSVEQFQAGLAQNIAIRNVAGAIESTAFAPKTVAGRLSDLNDQEREVQEMLFKVSEYTSQVKITDDMLKAYYEKNASQFEVPEQVKAEYVLLNIDTVMSQISVSDADIKSYYDQNAARYTEEEQRRASHILIKAGKDASDAEKAAAKDKAEKLLAQLRKNPAEFAKLAKENSQDPGSAEVGGDLGFFGKGMMTKTFEDAAFTLKQGEISDPVLSDYGYHIIRVSEIRPAKAKSLDEVKGQIAGDIKKQLAAKKFAELAEQFTDMVYEQSESLKPVADKLNLKIETATGLGRTPNPAIAPNAPFNHPKFLTALFSDEALKNKRNTEAVEVAPNTLIAGHVIEHKPVTKRPFEEVKANIRERVTQEEALKLAKEAGQAKLAAVKASGETSGFGDARIVSRAKNPGLNGAALSAVMKADVSKLPAYVGVEMPGQGYGVYRINKVAQPATVDAARREAEQEQIANALAQQETLAYIEALKKKAKVQLTQTKPANPEQDAGEKK